ncbi:MAG: ASKHA domain-containing protein [bacterium]
MKKIKLLAGDYQKTISVVENSNLLTVIQQSGLFIDAPCGGSGACKKCTVFINGKPCLACRTVIKNDLIVSIPVYSNKELESKKEKLDKHFKGIHIEPAVKTVELDIDPRSREFYQSDLEYLRKIAKLNISVQPDAELISKISACMHKKGRCTLYLWKSNNIYELVDILDRSGVRNLGLAIDLGTTTVSLAVTDCKSGGIIDSLTFYNPQIIYGADIIHRIVFAQKGNGAVLLKNKVIDEINRGVTDLCLKNNLQPEEIKSAVISGNTTMIHLLLGLPTKFIREEPFSPAAKEIPPFNSSSLLDTIKRGKIFIIPCVANYLGGDLVSGINLSGLHKKSGINILLDIGTNGEIIIGNRDWLVGCACSAGPAFEGMGINCGMRYMEGAVTGVKYYKGRFEYSIAGNSEPRGISGTGAISLLKHLREENYIDKRGKFTGKVTAKIGSRKAFILFDSQSIYVDETDIDNLLRAKAAIYSGMSLIMKKLEIPFSKINNLYIAGGIGNSLSIEDALDIGLLPPVDRKKVKFIGNSSLKGAIKYLLSEKARKDTAKITKKTTYIDLSNEPQYINEYTAALFIPHTNFGVSP